MAGHASINVGGGRVEDSRSERRLLAAESVREKKVAAESGAKVGSATKRPTIAASWETLESQLKSAGPLGAWGLNPGATDSQIELAEQKVGAKLPADFRESLRRHNGQSLSKDRLFFGVGDEGYRLQPLAEIARDWKMWTDGIDHDDEPAGPEEGIRDAWFHPQWIPFAENGCGDCLCLDLAPTKTGSKGQVITVYHDNPKRELLAKSFRDWLASVASELVENGVPE